MANWKTALEAKNYTPQSLGAAGQNGIKEYNELESDLAELKSFEGEEGYDAKMVANIEKDLLRLDGKITKAIEMRESQLANMQKMQQARGKSKEAKVVVKQQIGETPPAQATQTVEGNEQTQTVEEKKEDSGNFWGWVTGVAAVGFAAVIGVNVLKNR